MAEIDNTVALGVKPVPPPDIIGPITSLAQLQYLQAHGALEGAQAQFQQGKIGALQQYGDMVNSGTPPEDAITKSSLGAYDPAGANAMLGNITTSRTLKSNQEYATTGDPNSLAIQGPEAKSKGIAANVDMASYNHGYQLAKTGNEVAIQRMNVMGQIAGGVLATGDVNGQPPAGGIPAAVRQDAISKALSAGLIDQQTAAQESKLSDGDFWNVAKSWAGAGMGAKDAADVSGRAAGAQTAATQANTPRTLDVTQGIAAPPSPASLPASGAGSPGLSNNSYNNPGNIRDGAFAQSQPGYAGNYKGFAIYSSPLYGQAAAERNLMSYDRQGINTPTAIAAKWAPAGDGANDPVAYAKFIAGKLGISPDTRIDMSDPKQRAALVVAMSQQENGAKNANPGGVPVSVTAAAGSGFGGQPMALPAGAGGAQPQQTPLQAAAALPISPAAFTQPGKNTLGPPPPPQLGAAPIPSQPAPVAPPPAGPPGTPPLPAQGAGPAPGPAAPPVAAANGQWLTPPAMTIDQKAAAEAVGHGSGEMQVKQLADAKARYQTATTAQTKLGELQSSLDDLPEKGGWLTPGSGATERLGAAKYVNTLLQSAGAKPFFDPQEIGNAENSQKLTGTLGFDMSKGLGSREAASITETAIKLNPGIENTPTGRRIISGALNAGMQRDRDFYQFISQNGNTLDADLKFNQTHPSAQYIQEAHELAGVPGQAIKRLQANPQLAPAFEQKYGAGLSRYFTGQ